MVQSIINNIPLLRSVLGNQQLIGQQTGGQQDGGAGDAATSTLNSDRAQSVDDDQVEISSEALQRFQQANSTLSEDQIPQVLQDTRSALAENEGVTLGLEEEPA